ncbi:ParA family protein [Dyella kyungheensis]|uniref:ParA family protein n=1 Tax=Dyella kyungheensis TaxID=1242174 RepID=UPI003CF856F8
MAAQVLFDNSLSIFADLIFEKWGGASIEENIFLRDVSGRLTFVVLDHSHDRNERIGLARCAVELLDKYVDGSDQSVATPEELYDDSLRGHRERRNVFVQGKLYSGKVSIVDRRMVGADWLRLPSEQRQAPLRLVFASLKGGVGRSTALCVLAAHLSSRGRRVLALDMDLEAPGLGNMLLPGRILPEFGLLDYLVESGLGSWNKEYNADLVGPSWLGAGRGRVDVIPAVGRRSLEAPGNVLAKIARAYISAGPGRTFTDQINDLLEEVAPESRYDVILIDARAGLHETTAAALLGIGAEIFLFGSDQSQTYAGFTLLFSHLGTLPLPKDEWSDRLRVVQSKAPVSNTKDFPLAIQGLFSRFLGRRPSVSFEPNLSEFRDEFNVEWDEQINDDLLLMDSNVDEPTVVAIGEDEAFRQFDPDGDRSILSEKSYGAAFGDFLEMASRMVDESVRGLGSDV